MAKKKNDDNFYDEIADLTGGQVFGHSGFVKYHIDTGNLALNYCCSGKFIKGGIPGGRITEAFGPEASAKSLVGYSIMGATQRAGGYTVYLDCERAGNPEFAARCGHLDPNKLITFYPPTFTGVEKKVIAIVKTIRERKGPDAPILITWDSIGVTMSDREWDEVDLPENPTKEQIKAAGGSERPGERAKDANRILRKLNSFLDDNNATMYVVNQLRSKIGVMFGDPDTTAGGGRALAYYASCRLRFNATKQMKEKGKDIPIGTSLTVNNRKNRSFDPFWKTNGIQLYFRSGINPVGGLLSVFLNSDRIVKAGKGSYKVCEPWADGKDYTFKSSQERNDVPLDLLYDCPGIIDAGTAEEVREYLSPYAPALDLTNSNTIEEVADNEEDELKDAMNGEEE